MWRRFYLRTEMKSSEILRVGRSVANTQGRRFLEDDIGCSGQRRQKSEKQSTSEAFRADAEVRQFHIISIAAKIRVENPCPNGNQNLGAPAILSGNLKWNHALRNRSLAEARRGGMAQATNADLLKIGGVDPTSDDLQSVRSVLRDERDFGGAESLRAFVGIVSNV